jgi:hypothetical protein
MRVNEYIPNLDVEAPVWLDALERFYRPWQLFQLKRPARREKNTSNMADVRPSMTSSRDVTASPLYMESVKNPYWMQYNCYIMPENLFIHV